MSKNLLWKVLATASVFSFFHGYFYTASFENEMNEIKSMNGKLLRGTLQFKIS